MRPSLRYLVAASVAGACLPGCGLIPAAPGFGYSTGRARVEVTGLPSAPSGPLMLLADSSGYSPDASDPTDHGATAAYETADGWAMFLSRFGDTGRTGEVSLWSPDGPGSFVVAGSLPLQCELDATEGYPEVFAGTLRCPHLVHKGDEVSLVVALSARQ